MKRQFLFLVFLVAIGAHAAYSQNIYTPEKGSAVRKEILDALRVPVEKKLNQKIIFSIDIFNVRGNWAFFNGSPQSPDGGQPDYHGTPYQKAIDAGAFDNNFQALLKKTGGKWKVITYAIGCTDVCWYGWWTKYKAPKAIFPGTD